MTNATGWTSADNRPTPTTPVRVTEHDTRRHIRSHNPGCWGAGCWAGRERSEGGDERVAGDDVGPEGLDVVDDLAIVGDHHDRRARRDMFDLGTDHVVCGHPVGREDHPDMATTRRMGPDHRSAVEHDGDVGAVAPCEVLGAIDQCGSLMLEPTRRATPASRRCSRRRRSAHRRRRGAERRPPRSRSPRRAAQSADRRTRSPPTDDRRDLVDGEQRLEVVDELARCIGRLAESTPGISSVSAIRRRPPRRLGRGSAALEPAPGRDEAAASARASAAASRSRAWRISLRVSINSARTSSISSRAFETSARRSSSSVACSAIVASRWRSSTWMRAAACSAAARRFSARFRSRRRSVDAASASRCSMSSAAAASHPSPPASHSRPTSSTSSGSAPAEIADAKRRVALDRSPHTTERRSGEALLGEERLQFLRERDRRATLLALGGDQHREFERRPQLAVLDRGHGPEPIRFVMRRSRLTRVQVFVFTRQDASWGRDGDTRCNVRSMNWGPRSARSRSACSTSRPPAATATTT